MSFKRDIAFLLAGATIGIPCGIFSNYLYDWFFPATITVNAQAVGVQSLNPIPGGHVLQSSFTEDELSGVIEVQFAQGTDPSRYKCRTTVSHPTLVDLTKFDRDCRRLRYKFKPPSGKMWGQHGTNVLFKIHITSPDGAAWEGTEQIFAWYTE